MSDRRYDRDERLRPEPRDREVSLTELVDGVVRKVVTALVIAGGIIGLGAYASGRGDVEAPQYQISAAPDGRVYRVNTESGTVIACQGAHCAIVLQRHQDLDDNPDALNPPPPAARPALPAPAQPQNAAAPAPSTQATPAPAEH